MFTMGFCYYCYTISCFMSSFTIVYSLVSYFIYTFVSVYCLGSSLGIVAMTQTLISSFTIICYCLVYSSTIIYFFVSMVSSTTTCYYVFIYSILSTVLPFSYLFASNFYDQLLLTLIVPSCFSSIIGCVTSSFTATSFTLSDTILFSEFYILLCCYLSSLSLGFPFSSPSFSYLCLPISSFSGSCFLVPALFSLISSISRWDFWRQSTILILNFFSSLASMLLEKSCASSSRANCLNSSLLFSSMYLLMVAFVLQMRGIMNSLREQSTQKRFDIPKLNINIKISYSVRKSQFLQHPQLIFASVVRVGDQFRLLLVTPSGHVDHVPLHALYAVCVGHYLDQLPLLLWALLHSREIEVTLFLLRAQPQATAVLQSHYPPFAVQ